jgi:hypothetical protein
MNFMVRIALCLVLALPVPAQQLSINHFGYTPVGKARSHHSFHGLDFVVQSPVCAAANIPTADKIKNGAFETYTVIKTASQAAQLGITWIGSATGSVSADQLIAITDTSKSASCLATDGVTIVHYGRTIRTVVQMNNYTVKAGATIAIVAASATASGETNSVDMYEIGFGDPTLDQKLVTAKQIVSGSGIGIENYNDFMKATNDAETYAVGIANPGIEVVAYDSPYSDQSLQDSLASSWALKNIAEGRGCQEAISNFKLTDVSFQNVISSIYAQVANGCGVDQAGKDKAAALLGGLKITY